MKWVRHVYKDGGVEYRCTILDFEYKPIFTGTVFKWGNKLWHLHMGIGGWDVDKYFDSVDEAKNYFEAYVASVRETLNGIKIKNGIVPLKAEDVF